VTKESRSIQTKEKENEKACFYLASHKSLTSNSKKWWCTYCLWTRFFVGWLLFL